MITTRIDYSPRKSDHSRATGNSDIAFPRSKGCLSRLARKPSFVKKNATKKRRQKADVMRLSDRCISFFDVSDKSTTPVLGNTLLLIYYLQIYLPVCRSDTMRRKKEIDNRNFCIIYIDGLRRKRYPQEYRDEIYSCVKCIFRSKVTKEMTVFPEFLGNWEERAKEDLQDLLDLPAHRLKENIFQFQDRRALPDLLVRPACL